MDKQEYKKFFGGFAFGIRCKDAGLDVKQILSELEQDGVDITLEKYRGIWDTKA